MRLLRILSAASLLVLASGLALAAEPTLAPADAVAPVEAVAPVDAVASASVASIDDVANACELNYTPADPEEAEIAMSAKGCKACQDRPWCKCTYNGLPRVSCNPCCYGNLGIPQTCFD
jgi:hypothetical protein